MFGRFSVRSSSAALFLGLSLSTFASAADNSTPIRAARLTYLQGSVTVSQAGNAGMAGQTNQPLLTGVQVATGQDGQAEIEFEDGSVARLTPNSALSLDELSVEPDGVFITGLSLLRGLAYFELRATPQYLYMVNAGGDMMSPVENTTVRINFDQPPAIFAVLDGTAQVQRQSSTGASSGYQTDVRAGESLSGDPTDPGRYFLTQEIAGDSWDQWNIDLDQAVAAEAGDSTAVRNDYAGAQGYGWSDLDANGSWYEVPGEGPVWQPEVAAVDADFDPYGDGAWVAYPAVGYVWASAYPWGWTPYRCGSWSYYNGFGWSWAPGASCGGAGWGFAGGGRPVNIGRSPTGYRPIHVPVGISHPVHPVLAVHIATTQQPSSPVVAGDAGARRIDGVVVTPIAPVVAAGAPAAGSALSSDYPVDSATHKPIVGLASTQPAVVRTTPAPRSNGERPAAAGYAPAAHPAYSGQSGSTQPARGQPYSSQTARPAQQQTTPVQHNSSSAPEPSHPAEPPHQAEAPHPAPEPAHSNSDSSSHSPK